MKDTLLRRSNFGLSSSNQLTQQDNTITSSAFGGPGHHSRKSQQMHQYSSELLKGYKKSPERTGRDGKRFGRMVLDDEIQETLDDEIMKI